MVIKAIDPNARNKYRWRFFYPSLKNNQVTAPTTRNVAIGPFNDFSSNHAIKAVQAAGIKLPAPIIQAQAAGAEMYAKYRDENRRYFNREHEIGSPDIAREQALNQPGDVDTRIAAAMKAHSEAINAPKAAEVRLGAINAAYKAQLQAITQSLIDHHEELLAGLNKKMTSAVKQENHFAIGSIFQAHDVLWRSGPHVAESDGANDLDRRFGRPDLVCEYYYADKAEQIPAGSTGMRQYRFEDFTLDIRPYHPAGNRITAAVLAEIAGHPEWEPGCYNGDSIVNSRMAIAASEQASIDGDLFPGLELVKEQPLDEAALHGDRSSSPRRKNTVAVSPAGTSGGFGVAE